MAPSPGQGLGVLPSRGLEGPVHALGPWLHVCLSLAVPWASLATSLCWLLRPPPLLPTPRSGPLQPPSLNPSQARPPNLLLPGPLGTLQCEMRGGGESLPSN